MTISAAGGRMVQNTRSGGRIFSDLVTPRLQSPQTPQNGRATGQHCVAGWYGC